MKSLKGWMIAAFAALAACGAAQAKEMTIGAVYLDSQGFYAGVRNGIEKASAASGEKLKLIDTNAAGDLAKESSFVDTLVANKVSAIILSAVSADGSVRAIRDASRAGIPVICYNTCVNDAAMKKYVTAYVVGDAFKFGEKTGEAAAAYLVQAGIKEPRIGVLNCEFVEVCVQRRKGFEHALLAKVPGAKIVANQEATIIDKALSIGQAMLAAHPEINVFYGESGGATLGAAKAVEKSGASGKVVVFGSDMTTEIANALVDNKVLKAAVDVSGTEVGKLAFGQALAAAQGKKPASPITPATISLYDSPEAAKAWLAAHPDGLP